MSRRRRDRLAAQAVAKRRAVRGLRFESLESRAMLAADFGDAINFTSASHEAVGPQLGPLRDANAQVLNSLATGDASDEDGIVFGVLRAGQSASVTVFVANAPAGAKLDAWINFNRDGDFTDAGEQIIDNVAVVAGDNVVAFAVPVTVVGGANFARFRLSTAGNLNPSGAALDGEVEDYLIPIADAGSGIFGGQQPIGFDNVSEIAVTDLDGDGYPDILNANQKWRSNANGRFGPELPTGVTGTSTGMLAPADVDGDGDMDFFAYYSGTVWYENNGAEIFTRRTIDANNIPYALAPFDLDGDGDLDLVTATINSNVFWYANDGHQVFTRMTAAIQVAGVQFVAVEDMDGDGDFDILTGTPGNPNSTIRWLENDGQQHFTVRTIATAGANLSDFAAGDFDGDGDLDVVASFKTSGGVVFYENDGTESFTPANLDATVWTASAVDVADFDADGDLDVAASGTNRVAWYENDGAASFTRRIVTAVTGAYFDVTAADVNGDGRLDLVTAGTGSTPLAWYEQLTNFEYDYGDAPRPYRVYAQDQGPRHRATGPRLGATRDAEDDGAHASAGAEAEDDGVAFGTLSLNESTGMVTVNVQNAPAGAKLDAWIDFDGDGSWGVDGEQIAKSVAVVEGDNALTFAIPSWAVAGATYARFRLSTAGGHGPQGTALDGEVEDHPVAIIDRAPASGVFGGPQVIGFASSPYGEGFTVTADVDGDGDVDVVSKVEPGLKWAENLGSGEFAIHSVGVTGFGGEDFAAGDLDNDGDVDFVGLGQVQQKEAIIWAENDGEQNFTRRSSPLNNSYGTFVAFSIADMDADGDMDLLCAGLGAGIYILANNGRQEFVVQSIGAMGGSNTSVVAADMDADGDLDVVAGGRGGSGVSTADVAWFQNNGGLSFTHRGIERSAYAPFNTSIAEGVAVGDVDGDGDLDVVSAGVVWNGNAQTATLVWHEQVAGNAFVDHVIETGRYYRWASLGDFNGDGDLDVVAVGYPYSHSTAMDALHLFENIGGAHFIKSTLAEIPYGGFSNAAADMDGDGDLDIVAQGVGSNSGIAWFENFNLVDPDYGDAPVPYPSTRSNDGAVHSGGGPRLGATRTSEADGTQSPNADGDSGDDGVAFSPIQVGQASATVTVNVQNAPAGARLDAWIDFNGDGSWGGAGEQIFASYVVVEGDNLLVFDVPAHIPAGSAVARFRLSTAGGLRPGGVSLDGEVEDYRLVVDAPDRATGEYQTAASIAGWAVSIRIADIDGDGDADLLTVGQGSSPLLAWHENLDDGAYLTHTHGFRGVSDARPVDFDDDGDVDFVVIATGALGWYENNGQQNFTYRSTPSTGISLLTPFDLADVDSDGDLDVIFTRSSSGTPSQRLGILINDGQQRFTAQPALASPAYPVSAIRASDIDRDGDIDFAVAFESDASSGAVGWYENVAGAWTFHDLTTVAGQPSRAARDVVPIDFDFDGDVDLVAITVPNPTTLELFRNDGNQVFARETLASGVAGVWTITPLAGERLQVADLDGDGDYDAVAGTNNSVRLYRNEGTAGFTQFNIAQGGSGSSMPVAVGDLDGDGRLEIVASSGLFDDRPFGDYDRNGMVDQADRDLYEATLGQPAVPPGSGADGDRSGVVDAADLALWEANQGAGMTPPVRPADLNQDERIDGADFLSWQRSFGVTTSYPGMHPADLDFSATVDGGDLAVWARQFGQGVAPPATTAVVAASSTSSATASAAMVLSSPALESAPEPLSTPSPAPASRFALPASVIRAASLEKPASKKPDAIHLLKRSATSPRDAAFAALSSPASIPLRQRLREQPSKPIASSDEAQAEIDAAFSDECLRAVLKH